MSLDEAIKVKDNAIEQLYLNSEKRKNLISDKILKLYSELNDEENSLQEQIKKVMETYFDAVQKDNELNVIKGALVEVETKSTDKK